MGRRRAGSSAGQHGTAEACPTLVLLQLCKSQWLLGVSRSCQRQQGRPECWLGAFVQGGGAAGPEGGCYSVTDRWQQLAASCGLAVPLCQGERGYTQLHLWLLAVGQLGFVKKRAWAAGGAGPEEGGIHAAYWQQKQLAVAVGWQLGSAGRERGVESHRSNGSSAGGCGQL
jgi:hypothetical protein